MNKQKFVIQTVDEKLKRFIPVDCIGAIATAEGTNIENGKTIYGLLLSNRFSGGSEWALSFPTEIQRNEKLQEVLKKVSER